MFMAPIRFFACLIIVALGAATDTNSTGNVNASQKNVSWKKSGQVRRRRAGGEDFKFAIANGVRLPVLIVASGIETVITSHHFLHASYSPILAMTFCDDESA